MLEKYAEADEYFLKAKEINPAKMEKYAYLAAADSNEGKAAEEPAAAESIIFVEERE